ncbi:MULTISPECIES: LLM class flavin-dependent oxidoreductase [Clostridium]|uniref:LLM class flavin-dependent oxidoreductase n=1 Tax=Clostridium frigoriphilum TaxID=443253 RepID=A0ABU7UVQ5_9CLOT|nr:LLM class flavin-dependent oxidoreductase [Clostridium sp. DSM 17811]MBU3098717.1 LLM class flavin-dependent oxidoreductase [Clostridium sp. DSM 17811]
MGDIRNEIKAYIALSGWTISDIVREINNRHITEADYKETTPQNLSNKLSRGTIKYSESKEIANIIGYKIDWVKL